MGAELVISTLLQALSAYPRTNPELLGGPCYSCFPRRRPVRFAGVHRVALRPRRGWRHRRVGTGPDGEFHRALQDRTDPPLRHRIVLPTSARDGDSALVSVVQLRTLARRTRLPPANRVREGILSELGSAGTGCVRKKPLRNPARFNIL